MQPTLEAFFFERMIDMQDLASFRVIFNGLLLLILLFIPLTSLAEKVVPVWTYYQFPPFVTGGVV